MEKSVDNRQTKSRQEAYQPNESAGSYYEHAIDDKRFYKREMGGDLPPFYVQKSKDSQADVVVSERFIGIAPEGERAVGDDELADNLRGRSAHAARTILRQDWSENKSYGAAIAMAEDGIAVRSVADSHYRVVALDADTTRTLGTEGDPTDVYRPTSGVILAIVDVETAERLHQTQGINGLREIENDLLSSNAPYATVTITEERARAMTAAGGLSGDDIRTKEGTYEDPLAPQNGTFRQRTKSRTGKYYSRARDAVMVKALMVRNKFNRHPDRRDDETDEQYNRREKRIAAAIAIGGIALLAALWAADSANSENGLLHNMGESDPYWPPELDQFNPHIDAPDVQVPDDVDLTPDFSIPNIDLVPDREVGVPFVNTDAIIDPPKVEPEPITPIDPVRPGIEPVEPIRPTDPAAEPAPSDTLEYSAGARAITPGEGWYDTFDQLGINNSADKASLIANDDLMNRLEALDVAYPDSNLFGDWGVDMTSDGRMPEPALDLIMDEYAELQPETTAGSAPNPAAHVESLDGTPAQRIDNGEGWYQTFTEMGITDPNQQYNLLHGSGSYQMMTELQQMGLAYPYGNSWRIYMTDTGMMPSQALEIITKHASAKGYGLAA